MLCELRVRDLLLLSRLEITLEPGFNALTGETGAGKSVIVGALNLVLGGRASTDQIRPGSDEAEVEALFDISDSPAVLQRLESSGVLSGSELIVRRVIQASGRSRTYLNGRLCTAAELVALAPDLADIASQHESVSLTDPATHLAYLDAFGGLDAPKQSVAACYDSLHETAARVASLEQRLRTRSERDAFLRFQLADLDEVAPRAGEMEELKAERLRLRSAARLGDAARSAAGRLTESDPSMCDELRRIAADLGSSASLDPWFGQPLALVESALGALEEAGRDLTRHAEHIQNDPQRLDEVEERLFRIERLLRTHGPTESDAVEARARLARELEELQGADEDLERLREELGARLASAAEAARRLSEQRKNAAGRLGAAIGAELSLLGMGSATVVVDVAPLDGARDSLAVDGARLSRDGIDRVEFLIAPNKGIPPRPLRKIASGGELSRALLALKRVLASNGPAGLHVFDEVDTGVGGAIAECIGRALADIARHRQVFCITHLAPIAALADAHFVVEKAQDGEVATSQVRRLTAKARTREVARMLSGARITQASLQTAEELLRARAARD